MIYTKLQKIILGVAAGACVLFVVASIVHGHYADKLSASQRESDALKGQVQQLVQHIDQSRAAEARLSAEVDEARSRFLKKYSRLDTQTTPAITHDIHSGDQALEVMRNHGVVATIGNSNIVTEKDSVVISEAMMTSDKLSEALALLSDTRSALNDSIALSEAQGELIKKKDSTALLMQQSIEVRDARIVALDSMVSSMRKEASANEVKWYVKVGSAALIAYVSGRHLR